MTDKELRELAEKATPGPWKKQGPNTIVGEKASCEALRKYIGNTFLDGNWSADAEYIAAANPAKIIELLDRVEKAEKVCEMLYQNTGMHCSAVGKCIGCGKESTPALDMYCRKCIYKALMEWKEAQ